MCVSPSRSRASWCSSLYSFPPSLVHPWQVLHLHLPCRWMYQQFITSYQVSRHILQKHRTLHYLFQGVNVSLFTLLFGRLPRGLHLTLCLGNYNRRITHKPVHLDVVLKCGGDTYCLLRESLSEEGEEKSAGEESFDSHSKGSFHQSISPFFQEHTTEWNHSCFQRFQKQPLQKPAALNQQTSSVLFLVPHLGQTVKGKKYWITRLIFWQGQKFSRILISPIHLPLQSSNNNERKIQPTHIKNILTWCLNHHLDPAELVSVVSEEKNFWTAPHMSDITGGAWLDR